MADPGTHVRQGDILAVAVAAVPAEAEPVPTSSASLGTALEDGATVLGLRLGRR
jgi:hypothetical protein